MAIDSGEFASAPSGSNPLFASVLGAAYAHNVPLTGISLKRAAEFEDVLSLADSSYAQFGARVSEDHMHWRNRFSDLALACFATRPTNALPVLRILREHWVWRWWEAARVIRLCAEARSKDGTASVTVSDELAPLRLLYAAHAIPECEEFLVAGGVVSRPPGGETEASDHAELAAFEKLVRQFDSFWTQLAKASPGESRFSSAGALALAATLRRFAALRSPWTAEDLELTVHYAAHDVASIQTVLVALPEAISHGNVARLASARQAWRFKRPSATNSGLLRAKGAVPPGNPIQNLVIDWKTGGFIAAHPDAAQFAPVPQRPFAEQTFSSWHFHISESAALLRAWLSRVFATIDTAGDGEFGSRLARFFAGVFFADEVSIFRLAYNEPTLPLRRFGFFTTDASYEAKADSLRDHMLEISGTEYRLKSVSYRAVAHARTEYLRNIEPGNLEDQISLPQDSLKFERARSVCVVPLMSNGGPWGAIELVSFVRHNFPAGVRARIEELSTIVAGELGRANGLHALDSVRGALGKLEADHIDNLSATVSAALSVLPTSRATAVLFRPDEDEELAELFVVDSRDGVSSGADAQSFIAKAGFRMRDDMVRASAGPIKRRIRDKAYVVVRMEATDLRGLFYLEMPFPMARDSTVDTALSGFASIITSTISILRSEQLWDREARRVVAHELTRIHRILNRSAEQLRRLGGTSALSENAKNDLHNAQYDISNSAESVSGMMEALTSSGREGAELSDVRLVVMKKRIARSKAKHARTVELRPLVDSAFSGFREAARSKKVTVSNGIPGNAPLVTLDRFVLFEVFSTVAQNAANYALPGTDVLVNLTLSPSRAVVRVSNVGPTLFREDIERLFGRGYRGVLARKKSEGQGLGLWFAKMAMNLADGDVWHSQRPVAESVGEAAGEPVSWFDLSVSIPGFWLLRSHR